MMEVCFIILVNGLPFHSYYCVSIKGDIVSIIMAIVNLIVTLYSRTQGDRRTRHRQQCSLIVIAIGRDNAGAGTPTNIHYLSDRDGTRVRVRGS